jgi:hypothetical protein
MFHGYNMPSKYTRKLLMVLYEKSMLRLVKVEMGVL